MSQFNINETQNRDDFKTLGFCLDKIMADIVENNEFFDAKNPRNSSKNKSLCATNTKEALNNIPNRETYER